MVKDMYPGYSKPDSLLSFGGDTPPKKGNFLISGPIVMILGSFCSSLRDKKLLLKAIFSQMNI